MKIRLVSLLLPLQQQLRIMSESRQNNLIPVATFDLVVPIDTKVYYAWATTGTSEELTAKTEQMADALIELQFRHRILAWSRSTIAARNEILLVIRPIFVAELLDQYRYEIERVSVKANDEAWRQYAQLGLVAVSDVSNTLEACVQVVANSAVACEELEEDLEVLARNEEAIEDEDKDGDEDGQQ
ncbi:hypothetical protein BGZ52_001381 [Haplosporangium bisporale]|nr:hypothetical protein BGZ52_001381 [Haplosporangium bisporale]